MSEVAHIRGTTWHGRKGDLENSFRYTVDYLMIDLDQTQKAPMLFGRNRGWLFSLFDSDHGGLPKKGLGVKWVRDVLRQHDIHLNGKILLLAQPRIFGHVFNPVSFWLCHDDDDALCAVIAEVSNTFGDRHSYLCSHPDLRPIQPADRLTAVKIFHVSPFQPIEGTYEFRFDFRDQKVGIWIDLQLPHGGVMANLIGACKPLKNRTILGALLRRPLGSRRVLGLIHWQALKLWWKGAKYRTRPEPPKAEVS